jgi:hypothetical protein
LDPEHRLNVISSTDLQHFENKVTLTQNSGLGPALAFGNGRLFIAWVGTDPNSSLNVMSSIDGVNFGKGDMFYLAWTGLDASGSLNLLRGPRLDRRTRKDTYSEASIGSPSLVESQERLLLAWPQIRLNIGQISESPLTMGDSFVKLRSDLSLADWFTPWNSQG